MDYAFYCLDVETTGLDPIKNDVIELSIYRLSDDEQKTWLIKPTSFEHIQPDALRVNGHKLEDITHQTKVGKDTYKDASKILVEIENWLEEDGIPKANRCMIGQNISFDRLMLEHLWGKCGASDSFPFGRRFLDTMIAELFLDYCKNEFAPGYSLKNLSQKYNVKNDKAHSAAADTKCTVEVFRKQVDFFKKALAKV